jgi:hypothetical protein
VNFVSKKESKVEQIAIWPEHYFYTTVWRSKIRDATKMFWSHVLQRLRLNWPFISRKERGVVGYEGTNEGRT